MAHGAESGLTVLEMTVDLIDGRQIFVNAISAWPFASGKTSVQPFE